MTTPQGTIFLIDRAPVDITYAHTIDFTSPTEQLTFWGSKVKYSMSNYTYIRRERRYIQLEKSFEELDTINYMYFRAREDSKVYYCFVVDREYVNDNVTRLYFEIDVLQSYMFDYTWKPSYIVQGHVDRWDANHKPIYSRTTENLDYGTEYVTESAYKVKPKHALKHAFYLVYCKRHSSYISSGAASEGTRVWGADIPYDIYLVPETSEESLEFNANRMQVSVSNGVNSVVSNENLITGTVPVADISGLQYFMGATAFGDFVTQIIRVPYLPFKYKLLISTDTAGKEYIRGFDFTNASTGTTDADCDLDITQLDTAAAAGGTTHYRTVLLKIKAIYNHTFKSVLAEMGAFDGLESSLPTDDMWTALRAKPYKTERDRRFESKLLTFPYKYNIFTDWKNPSALIKNEYLCEDKIKVKEAISFGFNTPRRYYIDKYRKDPEGREASIMQSIPLEQPIISDAYYSYMLQNKNQISANITNAKISGAMGVAQGAVTGASAGASVAGPYGAVAGAVAGAVKSGIDAHVNISAMIRSENAKQADLKNMPDTFANSNDCTFAIIDDSDYLTFYRKSITCDSAERLAQYWHMFGYIVQSVDVPKTRSRLRYNYIRTIGANIEGEIESTYLAQIKAIYDKGVTIWHYSATDFYPLDYSYENIERSLL